MKLLHLASGDLWAGAEVQLYHLATELAANQSIELLVVLLNEGQLADELRNNNIKIIVFDESKLSGFSIVLKLLKLVLNYRPDIIHTHRSKENIIGGLVAILSGRPSVRTVHGASEFTDNPFNLRREIITFLDHFIGRVIQKRIIAVSEDLAGKLSRIFPERKITVIPNGINIEKVRKNSTEKTEFTIDENNFNIAFIGRFVPVKRPDIFLDIAVETIAKSGAVDISFHMFGDGPLFDEVTRRIKRDDFRNCIYAHGFVSNIAPYLKKMDLLIFTSEHEGLPMTLLEAMSLDVAVMSRNLPTICHVLCDGECGYIMDTDAIEEYSAAIIRIYQDKSERKTVQKMAYTNLDENYSIKSVASRYEELYGEFLSRRR